MSQSTFPAITELPQAKPEAKSAYHLRIKVGAAEFDAEGPVEIVRSDYESFLNLIERVGTKAIEVRSQSSDPEPTPNVGGFIEENTWDKAFLRSEDKLSLNVLPDTKHSNGDAILLLIYGYQTLFQQDGVTSISLMEAAKQSGLRIDRIDRSLTAEHHRLILKGGSGKGTRYSLNNRGISYSQSLLEQLFD
ncbi:MAG: hypothetical protein AAF664_15880 [Planctomycetota bacterium]